MDNSLSGSIQVLESGRYLARIDGHYEQTFNEYLDAVVQIGIESERLLEEGYDSVVVKDNFALSLDQPGLVFDAI